MKGLGYIPCLADPDLWYKAAARPDGGFEYYSYILCYVDDILVMHHDSLSVLKKIDKYFKLKPSSIGNPYIYLGVKGTKMNLANNTWCWTLSPSKCIQEAVKNCEHDLKESYDDIYKLPKNAPNPFPTNMYAQCDPDGNQYVLLDSLIDCKRSTTALCYDDQKITANGRTSHQRSTAGWKLCCQWCKLSDLKESHPIETR